MHQAFGGAFSAHEWATETGRASGLAACVRWGGGRELALAEAEAFFGLLFELQSLTEELTAVAVAQLAGEWTAREAEWEARCGPRIGRGQAVSNSPLCLELERYLRGAEPELAASAGLRLAPAPLLFLPRSDLQFQLPQPQVRRFAELFSLLFGAPPDARPFLSMLALRRWRHFAMASDESGRPAAVGWTVRGGLVAKD